MLKINLIVHNISSPDSNTCTIVLRFPAGSNTLDTTGKFQMFTAREYNDLFNKYFIPTTHNNVFMLDKQQYDDGLFTIHCWTKTKTTRSFTYNDYQYTYRSQINMFVVKYIGDSEHIDKYPFGSFNGLDISYKGMYAGCNIKSFDMSKLVCDCCIDMSNMFENCYSLQQIDNFAITNHRLHSMQSMFSNCCSLTHIDMSMSAYMTLASSDVANCFAFCSNLVSVDISNLLIKNKCNNQTSMFIGCKRLVQLKCQTYTWNKIKSTLPCFDYWMVQNRKTLKPFTIIEIPVDNNAIALTFVNTFYDDISVVNIGDDKYRVLCE